MALARTYAIALAGMQGHVVEIEADIENGLVALLLVGLPDTALREARDRIRSAIINSQHSWPQRRITVGLSPASLPKRGSGFDLGIAVAILSAAGVVPKDGLAGTVFLGELGLDGRIRPVAGILPSIAAAAGAGFGRAVVPVQNAAEAALVPSMRVISAEALGPLIDWLRVGDPDASGLGVRVLDSGAGLAVPVPAGAEAGPDRDLADVIGQPVARRAAEMSDMLTRVPGVESRTRRASGVVAGRRSVPLLPGAYAEDTGAAPQRLGGNDLSRTTLMRLAPGLVRGPRQVPRWLL